MTVKIKQITYFLPPKEIFNDALDVFVSLKDDYCMDDFCYLVEVPTFQFLSTIMEKGKSAFLLPNYPCIIVSKLTDDIIRAATESFINENDEVRWLKLYHILPQFNIQEIDEILYRKKQEEIELEAEVDAEFKAESDTKD